MVKEILACVLLICFLLIGTAASCFAGSDAFEIRGIKGLWWDGIEKYQEALPWLAEHNLNFLMTCYTSFPASGSDWRSDYTQEEKRQLRSLARDAKNLGVSLCLSFNPGIWSKPPLMYSSEKDFDLALNKVKIVNDLGIDWISLCLDDINKELTPEDKKRFGNLHNAQIYFVNRLWGEMKKMNPNAKLIFCPSAYMTGEMMQHLDYTKSIGNEIDPQVLMFWTGPSVCSPSITSKDVREIAALLKRKPVIWDNYPVNDMYPWRPLLGPFRNRSASLASSVKGIVSNPMKQWHISKIPLSTFADYTNDPRGYDPDLSIEKAIKGYPEKQQSAIRKLVKLYGSSFWGDAKWPPRPDIASRETVKTQLLEYEELEDMLSQDSDLCDVWEDAAPTLEADIKSLRWAARDRRTESPLMAFGQDFKGGAGDINGYNYRGKSSNHVYAKATGKSGMQVEFYLKSIPDKAVKLRILAIADDFKTNPAIRITLNANTVYEGPANWSSADFEEKVFTVPASALITNENTLVVSCEEEKGPYGSPPWFLVTEAELILGDNS